MLAVETLSEIEWKLSQRKGQLFPLFPVFLEKQNQAVADSLVTTRLSYSIISVEGITDKSKIGFFIRNMPARDSLFLRKHMDKNEPGIEMRSWMDCNSCLEHSEVRLPLGASFFWPDSE